MYGRIAILARRKQVPFILQGTLAYTGIQL